MWRSPVCTIGTTLQMVASAVRLPWRAVSCLARTWLYPGHNQSMPERGGTLVAWYANPCIYVSLTVCMYASHCGAYMRTPVDDVLDARMPVSFWTEVVPCEEVGNWCWIFHSSELIDLFQSTFKTSFLATKRNECCTYFAITNSKHEVASSAGGGESVHCIF